MGYDILILTDHGRHTAENSVYALASAIARLDDGYSVEIASRATPENAAFFNGDTGAALSVIPVQGELDFQKAVHLFSNGHYPSHLTAYDFVLLRLPPPYPPALFEALPSVIPENHIVNAPGGIIHTSSKAFLHSVADLCPPMADIHTADDLHAFLVSYPEIVLKPYNNYAGIGIVRISDAGAEDTSGKSMSLAAFLAQWQPPYLGMKFLRNVTQGDKRTVVVDGHLIGSALRTAAPGSWVCNIARGGTHEHATPDDDERRICTRLSPLLLALGVVMYGFDTLVDDDGHRVLSEINTMSIGGLRQLRDAHGNPVLRKIAKYLAAHFDHIWYGEAAWA